MDADDYNGPSLGDALRAVLRQWPTLLAVVLAFAALATLVTLLLPSSYRSTAKVAVEPAGERDDLERVLFGSADLGTQREILTSAPLVRAALEAEGLPADDASIRDFVENQITVTVLLDTTVLEVTVEAGEAGRATRLAQALAEQYLAYLEQDAERRVEAAKADLETEERTASEQVRSIESQLAAAGTDARASLEEERDDLYARLRFVAARRVELDTTRAFARRGDIIEPATVPSRPASPNPVRNGLLALALGLTVGAAAAYARARRDDRLHDPDGVSALVPGVHVRTVPSPAASDATAATGSSGGEADAYRRVRSALWAADGASGVRRHTVTSVDDGDDGAHVAVTLAQTLADSGRSVLLVDADLRRGLAGALLGLHGPGLSEVLLAGAAAPQLVHHVDGLDVLLAGSAGDSARGRLTGPGLTAVMDELGSPDRDVVVIAPPVREAAESLEVLGVVPDAVLVVRLRRTTAAATADSLAQVRGVGATVRAVVAVDHGRQRAARRRA